MSWPFHSLHQFILMGGYAAFVWPAYTIALAVLIANVVQPLIQHKKILQQLQHDE